MTPRSAATTSRRDGKQNIIILTSGITGSSVLAGFLNQSGYWAGPRTHKKEYNTFENQDLIDLNLKIFKDIGYTGNYTTEASPQILDKIENLYGNTDPEPYRRFIENCDANAPWVWKDPRLWLTFRFWQHFLNLPDCRFILLTRDLRQAWLSVTLRRQIMSYGEFCKQELHVKDTILEVLQANGLSHVHITYDELIGNPEGTIAALNHYLESDLRVEDLKAVYTKPLYQPPRASLRDSARALLIYAKNYFGRAERNLT